MRIASSAFEPNKDIPPKYTCEGADVSPPLAIADVPPETKSLALIVSDPDAASGDFVHWTVWNIDPATKEMREGNVPEGAIEGATDFGRSGWGGPCPPSGKHRYEFHLYALNKAIDLPAGSNKSELRKQIENYKIAEAVVVGLYQKAR